ncbi:Rieske 2Fe-2S domain-containing protein [Hyphomicrobium sp.]|uniref:Rieske 2Fe-2S domain-containing protein n=1 Tax=Hyphomicrobium sp. TaxID=82 RepID=UPI0039E5FEE8
MMAFQRVCSVDDVWEGEMQAFPVGGKQVLIVNGDGGVLRAFDGICPHQEYPLVEGALEGNILTCSMHLWQFDIGSGEGVNPTGCKLKVYPVKIENGDILVDLEVVA